MSAKFLAETKSPEVTLHDYHIAAHFVHCAIRLCISSSLLDLCSGYLQLSIVLNWLLGCSLIDFRMIEIADFLAGNSTEK